MLLLGGGIVWFLARRHSSPLVIRVEGPNGCQAEVNVVLVFHDNRAPTSRIYRDITLPWQLTDLDPDAAQVDVLASIQSNPTCTQIECQLLRDGQQAARAASPTVAHCSWPPIP